MNSAFIQESINQLLKLNCIIFHLNQMLSMKERDKVSSEEIFLDSLG